MKATPVNKKKGQMMGTKGVIDRDEDEPIVARAVVEDDDTPEQPEKVAETPRTTSGGVEIVGTLDDSDIPTQQNSRVVSASISLPDNVEIVFLEELFDFPIIGSFNFQERFSINRIRKHQKFTVPRDVALVLMDKKLVTIPTML